MRYFVRFTFSSHKARRISVQNQLWPHFLRPPRSVNHCQYAWKCMHGEIGGKEICLLMPKLIFQIPFSALFFFIFSSSSSSFSFILTPLSCSDLRSVQTLTFAGQNVSHKIPGFETNVGIKKGRAFWDILPDRIPHTWVGHICKYVLRATVSKSLE